MKIKKIFAWAIISTIALIPAIFIGFISLCYWAVQVVRNQPEKYSKIFKDFLFGGLLD